MVIKIINVYKYQLNQVKMIILNLKYKRLLATVLTVALVSCSNPWDDRENNGDANLDVDLTEAIKSRTQTSEFAQLLVETGYDKVLSSSKTYTVFVPTNAAMAQVSTTILDNPESLKQFVENHIALTAYSSERKEEETQIKMYSNKYLIFQGNTMIDDATVVTANQYAKNGVFHIIDKPLTPKLNIWEYVRSQEGVSATSDYLLSLKEFNIYQSDSLAKAISEENGAGYLADSLTNSYLKNVYNLNNEKNSYTLFLMQDDGYNQEVDKMKPYLNKTTSDSTATYAKYFTLRDMAFHGKYEVDELPTNLISRFGVEVPVDKTQIVEEIHLSNGIIYIMKKVDVPLTKRLVTTTIQGEDNIGRANGPRSAIYYRERKYFDALLNVDVLYSDVAVINPGTARFMLDYSAKDLYSTTYKVIWRAINEEAAVFSQSLRFAEGSITSTETEGRAARNIVGTIPLTPVQIRNYEEVEVGQITLSEARSLDLISLIAADNITNGNNSLTLDYLKLVPVLK